MDRGEYRKKGDDNKEEIFRQSRKQSNKDIRPLIEE